ncbi:MAG: tetratricopeptide repeat protein [Candidatus Marinimicrobia bacterium]|nr:tetratricopeptide repeat protein [Candidatus Neomarinimicrobiota bacterium]MBT4295751.1 tetratricopeptide repeat protein [Candidatus Neomarinimicrobiota bacterium]MBT5314218.1 tetratricopeptide repeat protein [Candidatus Neomarinimicrobiota bacterium]MBT7201253.1 tetratricopeptide repeat protein [Candidatus Neomarinimicrobiota bacterium]
MKTYDTRAIDAFMDGMDLEAAGEVDQAILAYKRALSYDPEAVDIHFSLAKLYLQSQQKELAEAALLKVISYDSRNVDALELLGEISQFNQAHELALSYFTRVLDIDYNNDYAILQSAQIHHALGDTIREAEFLIRLWELDTDRVAALHRAESIYLAANDYDRITELYSKLIKRMPTKTDLVGRQIRLFLGMNRFFDAEALMDSLIEVAPYSMDLQSMKTDLVKVMHGEMAAVDYLTAVVRDYPDTWELKLKLSQLLIDAGESTTARVLLTDFLEIKPEMSNAVSMLVWTYLDVDDVYQARDILESYLPAFPEDFFLHRLMGSILHDIAVEQADSIHYQAALDAQRASLKLRPSDPQTLHLIANTLELFGRREEVLQTYLQLIELNAEDDLALNNYAYLITEGDVSEDTLRHAATFVERALLINPDHAPYLDTAGWIYFKLGHVQLARELIDRSLSINPENAEVLMHMGDVLEYLGKSNEAYIYYMRADKLR